MSQYLLEVRNLTKSYGELKAVDGISFGIPEGCCFGLLGPNGAGKSTTIEIIEGIKTADSGDILFRGKPRDASFSERCGIQFQSTALQDFLTVREVLNLFAGLYRAPVDIAGLVEMCELGEFYEQRASKLSGGQKQRLLLALALINDPEIIFLDEPTTGLDPQSRRRFWELIRTVKAQGKTVVLTTHYMDEAEVLCDEILIVDHGRIVDQGAPRSLLNTHMPDSQIFLDASALTGGAGALVETLGAEILADTATIKTTDVEATVRQLLDNGVDLSSFRVRNPSLEDLFIKLTGHALRE